ncbi:MAG: hypothetical protein GC131_07860 [Alphaproteobacteria bacterium]|nr:hypothetical protein [Alphaproteobacteria bacterium]
MTIRKIYFIHESKVFHPSVGLNCTYFEKRFQCEETNFAAAAQKPDLHEAVCWYMMGYYPKKLPAALTVHDYKSLSVPPFRHIKNFIKRISNARPDLRIVTPYIHDLGYFKDGVPFALQDIGVPDYVPALRDKSHDTAKPAPDFFYAGVLTRERKSHLMLDSFVRRFGAHKTFLLAGKQEPWLTERYAAYKNITFAGRMPQDEVFENLRHARVAVCYFPTHYPHIVQVPTKMLDAAAVGQRILANDQVMNRKTAAKYGINALWAPADGARMFDTVPETLDWPDNRTVDPTPFLWSHMVDKSGLPGLLDKALGARATAT